VELGTKRLPVRTICFRVVSDRPDELQPGLLQFDLVESRSHIHRVVVDERDDIVWVRKPAKAKPVKTPGPSPAQSSSGANGRASDCASAIHLKVKQGFTGCSEFVVKVDYSGGPPVVSGIRRGNGVNGVLPPAAGHEPAATRIARRKAVAEEVFKDRPDFMEYYLWFTLLEERSDEDVLATQPAAGRAQANGDTTFDVKTAITALRSELRALMDTRMLGVHDQKEKQICTPLVMPNIARDVLLIHEHVFMKGVRASGVRKAGQKPDVLSNALTAAFLSFCQGDLRVVDAVSDLNVEPDSAMMFLFAEYALVLLQVVDETTGRGAKTRLDHPEAQAIADRLIGDAAALLTWKRLAASFVLGQHVFVHAYRPRRSVSRPVFEDYVRTNFDVNERLATADLQRLRSLYGGLRFKQNVSPMADPSVRKLCSHHASNACEAFPGDLDRFLVTHHPNNGFLPVREPTRTVTVFLRDRRGAGPTVRRHVRREVASILKLPRAVDTSETMEELDLDPSRRAHLATMLAAYASIHRKAPVKPSALKIGPKTTVDGLAMRLSDLITS
jgi:hypothetical protein